jgi:hypothetical protein
LLCSSVAAENRNLVVLRDGHFVESYKGLPDECHNALWATYPLHPQSEPQPLAGPVIRNVPLKVVRAVRSVLSQLTRTHYREQLKAALASNNSYQRTECLAAIDFDSVELTPDTGKLLAFQLAQTIALIDGRELYTKGELSIVDYGDREDLVLTAMRDRSTNRLSSYAEVIAEAQHVGLSHPAS